MTIQDLVTEIKADLGNDVNSLGISDRTITQKINEALRKISAYAPYVESDNFPVIQKKVIMPEGTVSVAQVLNIRNIKSARMYENDTDLFSVNRYLYNYNDLSDPFIFLMQKNQLNTLQNFVSLTDWRYNEDQNTLYLSNFSGDSVSVIYLRKYADVSEVKDNDILQTIKEYSLALCKIIEGSIRRKLQAAPGAIAMDGESLVSEGTAEKQKLDDNIPRQFSYLRFGIRI